MPGILRRARAPIGGIVLTLILLGGAGARTARAEDAPLAHMVYFTLKDDTPAARKLLVEACRKYLAGHDGSQSFSVGTLAEDLQREVNDQEFDVALVIVFANKAAHDQYQTHPRHLQFIAENEPSWAKVRVFDAYLSP